MESVRGSAANASIVHVQDSIESVIHDQAAPEQSHMGVMNASDMVMYGCNRVTYQPFFKERKDDQDARKK